jgi:hypothetical protein
MALILAHLIVDFEAIIVTPCSAHSALAIPSTPTPRLPRRLKKGALYLHAIAFF